MWVFGGDLEKGGCEEKKRSKWLGFMPQVLSCLSDTENRYPSGLYSRKHTHDLTAIVAQEVASAMQVLLGGAVEVRNGEPASGQAKLFKGRVGRYFKKLVFVVGIRVYI